MLKKALNGGRMKSEWNSDECLNLSFYESISACLSLLFGRRIFAP
jgi:hypothetical protein